MSDNFCPGCGDQLTAESMNITEGVALCPGCGQLSRLSEVVNTTRPITDILNQPPAGCSVTEAGQNVIVYASLRSVVGFVGALFISLFWNGIVSVFVLIAIAGLYLNLVGPLPAWFPAPDQKGDMGLGMSLFLCVFLIPFVTVGSCMIGAMFLNAMGKVEIVIGSNDATVRTGVAFLVWSRRFDPTKVRSVSTGPSSWDSEGKTTQVIVIEADRTIKFGSLLQDERREWLQAVLHVLLVNKQSSQREELLAKARQASLLV